jgi:hypothetical protein
MRRILGLLLFIAGVGKVIMPLPGAVIAPTQSVVIGLVEVAISVCLFLGLRTAMVAAAVAFMSGTGIVLTLTSSRPCGCFGRMLVLERSAHLALSALAGLLAWTVCYHALRVGANASSTET